MALGQQRFIYDVTGERFWMTSFEDCIMKLPCRIWRQHPRVWFEVLRKCTAYLSMYLRTNGLTPYNSNAKTNAAVLLMFCGFLQFLHVTIASFHILPISLFEICSHWLYDIDCVVNRALKNNPKRTIRKQRLIVVYMLALKIAIIITDTLFHIILRKYSFRH